MKKVISRILGDFRNVKKIHRERKAVQISVGAFLNSRYEHLKSSSFNDIEAYKSWFRSTEVSYSSQNGEDGILLEIFNQIGIENYTFVEFGIGNGTQCNTANLINNFGWKGLMIEGDPYKAAHASAVYAQHPVKVTNAFITVDNINQLISEANLPTEIDLLSVDIDGNDYWVWKAIDVVKPRVVVAEFNASFGHEVVTVPYDKDFDRFKYHKTGIFHGMSLTAAEKLARSKGYVYIGCDSLGVNAFFVKEGINLGKFKEVNTSDFSYPQFFRDIKISEKEQKQILGTFKLEKV